MHLVLVLTIIFCFFEAATAWVVPAWIAGHTTSSKASGIPHRVFQVSSGMKPSFEEEMLYLRNKYNVTPSSDLVQLAGAAAMMRTMGTPLTPSPNDREYTVPVKVGNSTLNLLFDTGSSDTWGYSTLQPWGDIKDRNVYQLSGKAMKGGTYGVEYRDGAASLGQIYLDRVAFGGLVVPTFQFGAAEHVSKKTHDSPSDGVFGWASSQLSSCRPSSCPTWMETIGPQLDQPLFAVTLRRGEPGTIDLGTIEPKYAKSLSYEPVMGDTGSWKIRIHGYQFGSGPTIPIILYANVDTGNSLVILPDYIVEAYYSSVPSARFWKEAEGWIFQCVDWKKLRSLSFYLGGQRRTMAAANALYRPITRTWCTGAVQPSKGGSSSIGAAFLKSQYVVFKGGDVPMVGFANQK